MLKKAAIIVMSAFVASCMQERTNISTPFDPAEHAYAAMPGASVIYGQVAYRGVSGAVVTNSGKPVYLIPKTKYTMEMAAKYRGDFARNVDIQNLDGRLGGYIRMSAIAPGGSFIFNGVPGGSYLIVTNIEELMPALVAGYNSRERSLVGEIVVPAAPGSVSTVLDR